MITNPWGRTCTIAQFFILLAELTVLDMADMEQPRALNYRDSGVNIDAGNQLVNNIKPLVARTQRPEVLGGLGGFGAMFELPLKNYRQPVLVSGTDGVGTKLKLAIELGRHNTVGIDLVGMCVNDILVQGAEPLFFLDYYATGRLDPDIATQVVAGIAEGCVQSGTALVGGETAEMPGMYDQDDYDLAGFCVGIVEKERIIDGGKVAPGDVLLGMASSGPHSNGYSLIRKVIEVSNAKLHQDCGGRSLADALMAPTRIYVKPVLKLLQQIDIHAMAHITGGGLLENIPRVLPTGTRAVIDSSQWQRPAVFDWLQQSGNIEDSEMYRTFNCGIGMVLIVAKEDVKQALELLNAEGEKVFPIGRIDKADGAPEVSIT